MVNQEKLLEEIKSLSDSIRKKNLALRLGINERHKFLESTFRPVIEPIKQISQKIGKIASIRDGDVLLPGTAEGIKSEDYDEEEESGEAIEHDSESIEHDSEGSEYNFEKDVEDRGNFTEDKTNEEEEMNPSNISKLGTDIVFKGELGRKYVMKMLHSTQANRKYHVYGARLEDNGLMIGNSRLDVDDKDMIQIGRKRYKGTIGLFELLFKNKPVKYTKRDLSLFKQIVKETNAHKKKYDENSPIYRNRSVKYINIISGLFPPKKSDSIKRKAISSVELNVLHKKRRYTNPDTSGDGLFKNAYNTNVIYYNDINKLVERMRLLHEATQAGHTGLNNEWVALAEELRSRGVVI